MPIVDPRTGEPLNSPDNGTNRSSQVDPSRYIVDVDMSNFQQVVLEGSLEIPVVLDCWAPWCEPCKSLTPVLEKLAHEYAGAFVLAKLNIEDNQQIAAQLGIRSVPDVKLIMQGQLYDQFQGALPESQIREWLGNYLQAPQDAPASPEEQAEAALAAGDPATAKAIYQQLIQDYPDYPDYRIGLASALVGEGEAEAAREILDALPPEHRDGAKARGVRARIEFGEEAPSREELAALEGRDDSEAQFKRALRQVADGDYENGLEGLLALLKRDRAYGDDLARKTLLRVFDALGAEHPLTVAYRRKLFALLY
ncbi:MULTISPECIES: co-chaperone YbbN [unclassified Modicisalibacter]|uniref:tetratricopeptide repeat protein n=1 Tax=unclassified Modicisalibacter TaxID=2679913 RepID=UPI001CCDCE38|nr:MULTISPECIES: co-chaperone YbbN [unclassified Modicisalibacter]MBZ9558233.1 co-chaperone YbbN [Modicisalibacter sp. R2A 31.J]MBZ9573099.1 co-chaperone YbbN [Modicisalibacter sp. MOD 31.J]